MTLARRAFAGLRLSDARDGVCLAALAPEGPAMRAGLVVGDVLRALDGVACSTSAAVSAQLASKRAGDTVRVETTRGAMTVEMSARPVERYEGLAVRLGEATGPAGRVRTIAVSPEGDGPFPAMFFAQGHGLATIERAASSPANDALRGMVDALARRGYCVVRTDLRGVGDSEGDASAIGWRDERDDLRAGLEATRAMAHVDASRVTVLGHSTGALHAPWFAGARCAVLWGTGVDPWPAYLVDQTARVVALGGYDAAMVGAMRSLVDAVFARGESVEAWSAHEVEHARFADALGLDAAGMSGRTMAYWRALADEDPAEALRRATMDVHARWGSADWLSTRREHEEAARLANGTFAEVPGADHAFFAHATALDSFRAGWRGEFAQAAADAVDAAATASGAGASQHPR